MDFEDRIIKQDIPKIKGALKILQNTVSEDEDCLYIFSGYSNNQIRKFVITDKRLISAYRFLFSSGIDIYSRKDIEGLSLDNSFMSTLRVKLKNGVLEIKKVNRKDADNVIKLLS